MAATQFAPAMFGAVAFGRELLLELADALLRGYRAEGLPVVDALGQWPPWWRLYGLVSPSPELDPREGEALFAVWLGMLREDLAASQAHARRSA